MPISPSFAASPAVTVPLAAAAGAGEHKKWLAELEQGYAQMWQQAQGQAANASNRLFSQVLESQAGQARQLTGAMLNERSAVGAHQRDQVTRQQGHDYNMGLQKFQSGLRLQEQDNAGRISQDAQYTKQAIQTRTQLDEAIGQFDVNKLNDVGTTRYGDFQQDVAKLDADHAAGRIRSRDYFLGLSSAAANFQDIQRPANLSTPEPTAQEQFDASVVTDSVTGIRYIPRRGADGIRSYQEAGREGAGPGISWNGHSLVHTDEEGKVSLVSGQTYADHVKLVDNSMRETEKAWHDGDGPRPAWYTVGTNREEYIAHRKREDKNAFDLEHENTPSEDKPEYKPEDRATLVQDWRDTVHPATPAARAEYRDAELLRLRTPHPLDQPAPGGPAPGAGPGQPAPGGLAPGQLPGVGGQPTGAAPGPPAPGPGGPVPGAVAGQPVPGAAAPGMGGGAPPPGQPSQFTPIGELGLRAVEAMDAAARADEAARPPGPVPTVRGEQPGGQMEDPSWQAHMSEGPEWGHFWLKPQFSDDKLIPRFRQWLAAGDPPNWSSAKAAHDNVIDRLFPEKGDAPDRNVPIEAPFFVELVVQADTYRQAVPPDSFEPLKKIKVPKVTSPDMFEKYEAAVIRMSEMRPNMGTANKGELFIMYQEALFNEVKAFARTEGRR